MYLTPTEKHWGCDIEADGLLSEATQIWCVCVINAVTKEKRTFTKKEEMHEFLHEHPDCVLVGHNFIAYDLVMLNRHWGTRIPASRVVDTFVLSQLFNPGYIKPKGCKKGGHSLEAWGMRLKFPKTDFDDFSRVTPAMLRYCMNDTVLTAFLFIKLTERMRGVGFTETGAEIEHGAWNVIQNKQKRNGFPFNYKEATELYTSLRSREEELQNEIYKLFPPIFQEVKRFKVGYRKDGSRTKGYATHLGQYPELRDLPDGGYAAYDFVSFNLGSPGQRIEKLLELGWVPVEFTKKTEKGGGGNPKVDEDSLLAFAESSGNPEVASLAKWIVTNSRANMIRTWMDAYDETTGAIHGSLFIAGTLRYKHSGPNSANIPAVRTEKVDGEDHVLYGEAGAWCYEARDLWTCGDPSLYSLVGLDGTGIQARVLAHYAYSKSFADLVLGGDIHKHNIEVLGLKNKPAAKKFFYTFVMGGGGARLAADQAQFGTIMTAKEGAALKDKYIQSIDGFHDLIKRLQNELNDTGRITLCDGTPILVSSPHMVIPYLLQGDESRLMKKALLHLEEEIRRRKFTDKVLKVADIHDEWQYRVKVGYEKDFVDFALPCFNKAGEFFKYNLPIDGAAVIGKTWAETH